MDDAVIEWLRESHYVAVPIVKGFAAKVPKEVDVMKQRFDF